MSKQVFIAVDIIDIYNKTTESYIKLSSILLQFKGYSMR